jgi:acetyltransferase-like isoleucine patch superfamily enzyme
MMSGSDLKERKRMGQIPLEKEFRGAGALRSVLRRLLHSLARGLPMFPAWRAKLHRLRGVKIGEGVFIGSDVFIDNTYPESIVIEDYATIISRTFIVGHTFDPIHLKNVLQDGKNERKRGVILKRGCYVGAQSAILSGVTIGECSVVGAGSVVTDDIPPYSIAVGVPARVVRTFSPADVIQDYLVSNS